MHKTNEDIALLHQQFISIMQMKIVKGDRNKLKWMLLVIFLDQTEHQLILICLIQ